MSVARKKSFDFLPVTGSVFSSHTMIFRDLKIGKRPAQTKVNIYTYFPSTFRISIFLNEEKVKITIKSNDYCNGLSAKLEHLKSCGYIFNPLLSIMGLEVNHFGSSERTPVSHNQTSRQKGVDISILLGSPVLY